MDEEETDGYREPCGQCSAVNWGVSDEGRFYCKSCHNVIERMREVVDMSFIGSKNRISSVVKGTKRKKPEHGRQWMVSEGFQFILTHQADNLLNLGVSPHFKDGVLCQLWRLYLQKSRQAYTSNPVRTSKFKLDSDTDSGGDSSCLSVSETDGEVDLSTAGSQTGTSNEGLSVCSGSENASCYLTPGRRRNKGLMSMTKTLALLHLALLWTREALTLADLLRLVREGHILYVNAYECFPEEMKLLGRDTQIFRVESVPSHRALRKEAQGLAVYLDLPVFPPISCHCLLHPSLLTLRYLTDANLPDELHIWVCRVTEQAGLAGESHHTFKPRSKPVLPLYDVQAAALIIITMKLLFGIDDHTEWELSNEAGNQDKAHPEKNSFNVRRWYRTLQTALTRARHRRQDHIARRQWKSQKPIYSSWGRKPCYLKKRRLVEQLQNCFERLSGSAPGPQPSPPSSFRFRWGDEEGSDGPSLHHKSLDSVVSLRKGVVMPSNPEYWHPALKECKTRSCGSHYEEMEQMLPKTYVWLLELFSFLLEVTPASVYEEVLRVERRLLRGRTRGATAR
ncbi:TATA box-binding protein-associated factor RNA polymerase I subunit B [Polymixia lowei]